MKKGLLSVLAGGALVFLGAKKMFAKDIEESEEIDVEFVDLEEESEEEESEENETEE